MRMRLHIFQDEDETGYKKIGKKLFELTGGNSRYVGS